MAMYDGSQKYGYLRQLFFFPFEHDLGQYGFWVEGDADTIYLATVLRLRQLQVLTAKSQG